jgi:hypothetical protein
MPQFELKLEGVYKHFFFFKGGNEKDENEELDEDDFVNKHKGLMKKNYLGVKDDGSIVIKNLGIRKKSNSALSKTIFWEHLVPRIKEGQIKFSKKYIVDLINELLQRDIQLGCLRKEVGTADRYVKSEGSLPAQIARKYGPGIHFLIPNTRGLGVGKGKQFCLIREFQERNLTYKDVDTSGVLSELEYFIHITPQRDIFSYEDKK